MPQTYIPSIRYFSPQTKIVVITDDVHEQRLQRLNAANQQLSEPVLFRDDEAAFESEVYAQADAVMAVSESDAALLNKQLAGTGTSATVVHWVRFSRIV